MKRHTFIGLKIADRSDMKTIERLRKQNQAFERELGLLVIKTANKIASATKTAPGFPYITGFLKSSYQADTENTKRTLSAVVGSVAAYAPAVEFGTEPHEINSPVYIKNVGWRYIGMHPGTRPQPYFIPAVEKYEEGFYQAIEEIIKKFDNK
jgi:hypothetical protein